MTKLTYILISLLLAGAVCANVVIYTSGTSLSCVKGLPYIRYVDNNDGTVTDHTTGLMWTKNASHGLMGQVDGSNYCANLTNSGYSDWRLPAVAQGWSTTAEFDTFLSYPPGAPFTNVQDVYFTTVDWLNGAYYINMVNGGVGGDHNRTDPLYIWPVRGPVAVTPFVLTTKGRVENTTYDLEIITTNANSIFTITPLAATNLSITWGDGNLTNYTGSARRTNTYAVAGTYIVSLSGNVQGLQFGFDTATRYLLKRVLTPINGITGLKTAVNMFYACTEVTTYPTDMFTPATTNINSLDSTWYLNSKATNVPDVFMLVLNTTLNQTWRQCSVNKVFPRVDTMPLVKTTYSTWRLCVAATGFPDPVPFPQNENGVAVWMGTTNCLSYPSVAMWTKVGSGQATWSSAKAATYPSLVTWTNLSLNHECWNACTEMVECPDLSSNILLTTMDTMLSGCAKLKNAPVVATNSVMRTVKSAFASCVSITNNLPALWDTNLWPNIYLAQGSNHTACFSGCTGAANWAAVPADWK